MNRHVEIQTQIHAPVNDERVLVVKREVLFAEMIWQGLLCEQVARYQSLIKSFGEFQWRSAMEQEQSYKQIIPYMLFEYNNSYFLMERRATASEQRLQSKLSLGIGGHIREDDMAGGTLFDWAQREFREEVRYSGNLEIEQLGMLNDDSDAVGQVHMGFILILHGDSPDIAIRAEHKQGLLLPVDQITQLVDGMESWSKIVWQHLQKAV